MGPVAPITFCQLTCCCRNCSEALHVKLCIRLSVCVSCARSFIEMNEILLLLVCRVDCNSLASRRATPDPDANGKGSCEIFFCTVIVHKCLSSADRDGLSRPEASWLGQIGPWEKDAAVGRPAPGGGGEALLFL
jgi:hypothetical protein